MAMAYAESPVMYLSRSATVESPSGFPAPPNATPRTDDGIENVSPSPRLDAVGNALKPIQEALNESAEAAMLPSPPSNTPFSFSPAPSLYKGARNRGLSAVGDRLLKLKLEEHGFDKDAYATSSSRSVTASTVEEDIDEDAEVESHASPVKYASLNAPIHDASSISRISPTAGTIPLEMGSPLANPRIDEYINFQSADLPVVNPNIKGSSSTAAAHETAGTISELSVKSDKVETITNEKGDQGEGVAEKSNWAEELEEAAERIFLQMEQLAVDEVASNPNQTFEQCYSGRLARLLAGNDRAVKLEVRQKW
ncbi:unnamed protein product [Periconia digitata]|uniref:Uncharacterized protein n=1 Tax=Periconia digitata TaxID=1303443 RepID=A0A9W4UG35_9PLEO|nr:unnamed protein product [Periconia digitata]